MGSFHSANGNRRLLPPFGGNPAPRRYRRWAGVRGLAAIGFTSLAIALTAPVAIVADCINPPRHPTGRFDDVPAGHWAATHIAAMSKAGILPGCDDHLFCPNRPMTRQEMALSLERLGRGVGFVPPDATGVFNDVPAGHSYACWIEQLHEDGITGGCRSNPPRYCPESAVTRAQMAVFLVTTHETLLRVNPSYTPPACVGDGIFRDVPCGGPAPHWAVNWIEELSRRGITGGCGDGNFCPAAPVTRAQMAVFLNATLQLAQDRSPDYDVLVTSYPWSRIDIPEFTTRCPEWSYQQCEKSKGQNTPEYGKYVVSLANTYGIDFLSGHWSVVNHGTFDNFQASFPPSVDLGRLRLVYMAELREFEDATARGIIEDTIKGWREDVLKRWRYGYITDADGNARPIIMLWGDDANQHGQLFKAMIGRIRDHYAQVHVNPYIVMTEHGLWSGDDDIITAVDGFYLHSGVIPPEGEFVDTWNASLTVDSLISNFRAQVVDKKSGTTGLPIGFLAGGMEQYDRRLFYRNFGGGQPQGVIELNCRLQATEFNKLLRSWATVPGLQRPLVTLTSFNEWEEGSTIEPTQDDVGPPYPGGNNGYDLVKGLRQVFGKSTLKVDFGRSDIEGGLSRPAPEPSDGRTTAVTVNTTDGNVSLRMIEGTQTNARYIYVKVDDNELYDGSDQTATLTIQYADMAGWGGRNFWVQYDSASGAYRDIGNVPLAGDGDIKQTSFALTDLRFANRENGQADFRIVAPPSTRLHINMVTVIKSMTSRRTSDPCQ
jgi:hypothetical protein